MIMITDQYVDQLIGTHIYTLLETTVRGNDNQLLNPSTVIQLYSDVEILEKCLDLVEQQLGMSTYSLLSLINKTASISGESSVNDDDAEVLVNRLSTRYLPTPNLSAVKEYKAALKDNKPNKDPGLFVSVVGWVLPVASSRDVAQQIIETSDYVLSYVPRSSGNVNIGSGVEEEATNVAGADLLGTGGCSLKFARKRLLELHKQMEEYIFRAINSKVSEMLSTYPETEMFTRPVLPKPSSLTPSEEVVSLVTYLETRLGLANTLPALLRKELVTATCRLFSQHVLAILLSPDLKTVTTPFFHYMLSDLRFVEQYGRASASAEAVEVMDGMCLVERE